jgi:fermentation-respiration switch protein FrsA (DUF1100 family)
VAGQAKLKNSTLRYWLLLFVSVAAVVWTVRIASRRWIFPVHEVAVTTAADDVLKRVFPARDGTLVHALELGALEGALTVVYFHNNRETIESRLDLADALHRRGLGVLLVEYRGYGASRGTEPSEEGLYRDAEAALDMLASRGVTADRVVLWGTSLGTGVAAEMARRGRGARLILVTPYTSIPDLVTDRVPIVPARVLLADHFDTLAKSGDIGVPTTIVHGDADEIVPFWMGEQIARAIRGARLLRVPGGHHGDLFARGGDALLSELLSDI